MISGFRDLAADTTSPLVNVSQSRPSLVSADCTANLQTQWDRWTNFPSLSGSKGRIEVIVARTSSVVDVVTI